MPAIQKFGIAGVLGFTVFISFIDMIIAAVLVASYNRTDSYPSTHIENVCKFTLFASIFNIVFGGAFIGLLLVLGSSIIASIASFLVLLFLLWIFWLAVGASTANALGGPYSCSNNNFAHCHQLLAMEAFGWINFIVLFIAFFAVAFLGFRATRKGEGITAPLGA